MIRTLLIALLLFFSTPLAHACTLFGANGSAVRWGGTLMVKNRDWRPEYQEMRLVQGLVYRYYGIYGGNEEKMGLKGGVNEGGLAVFSAAASVLPRQERFTMGKPTNVLSKILGRCQTVEQALTTVKIWGGPKFLLLGDATELAYVEVGSEGRIKVRREKNAMLAHTNHYLSPEFLELNKKKAVSSHTRYERITTLLGAQAQPFTLDKFMELARDRHDGPDNSIWRTGSREDGPQTLVSFGVWLHPDAKPDVYLIIRYSPEDQGQEDVYQLDGEELWKGKAKSEE